MLALLNLSDYYSSMSSEDCRHGSSLMSDEGINRLIAPPNGEVHPDVLLMQEGLREPLLYPYKGHSPDQQLETILINGLFQSRKVSESSDGTHPQLINFNPHEMHLEGDYTPGDLSIETLLAGFAMKNLVELENEFYEHFRDKDIASIMQERALVIPHDHRTYAGIMETGFLMTKAANRYAREKGDERFTDIRQNVDAPVGLSVFTFGVDLTKWGLDAEMLNHFGLKTKYGLGQLAARYGNVYLTYPSKEGTHLEELTDYRRRLIVNVGKAMKDESPRPNGLFPVRMIAVEGTRTKLNDHGVHELGEVGAATRGMVIPSADRAIWPMSIDDVGIYKQDGFHQVNIALAAGEVRTSGNADDVLADIEALMPLASQKRLELDLT